MHTEVNSVADVAKVLLDRYSEIKPFLKRGEKSSAFMKILKELFILHGERLGFVDDFHAFKSLVVGAMNNRRKNSRGYSFHKESIIKDNFLPSEMMGEEYTLWQVDNLGLNRDSYY